MNTAIANPSSNLVASARATLFLCKLVGKQGNQSEVTACKASRGTTEIFSWN